MTGSDGMPVPDGGRDEDTGARSGPPAPAATAGPHHDAASAPEPDPTASPGPTGGSGAEGPGIAAEGAGDARPLAFVPSAVEPIVESGVQPAVLPIVELPVPPLTSPAAVPAAQPDVPPMAESAVPPIVQSDVRPDVPPVTPPAVPPAPPASPEPEPGRRAEWWRHTDGRWVVGDAGKQPDVVAIPSATAPSRPDTILDGARTGAMVYRAVSLRGLGHQQSGKPRQDSYTVGLTRDRRWLVGCVADGVSEGHRSDLAADIACREITSTLAAALNESSSGQPQTWHAKAAELPWQTAVDRATEAIVTEASARLTEAYRRRGDSTRAAELVERALTNREATQLMSTTAVAFVVAAEAAPDGLLPFALVVAAGDSSAQILADGEWCPITAVKNTDGDIASSAVRALPRQVEVRPLSGYLRPGQALAVISDGLGDPLGGGTGMVGRFLAEQWSRAPDLFEFAGHAAFYRKTFIDDRTAVVVWNQP